MDAEHWGRVEQLCQAALERDAHEQAAFLASACGSDPELRREVESLLIHRHKADTFLEAGAMDAAAQTLAADGLRNPMDASRWIGRLIPPYFIEAKVASGGMGDVFRAVRADGTFDKQVAIKLIQGARSTDFFLSRFQNERQILATLEHPNIAGLLDGGTTEDGLPYLVMEYIQGLPIDEFCNQKKLDVRERLALFRTVCSAVQFAHQNLVVHRDLKPSNILVTSDGIPKLLDFGIAKILNPVDRDDSAQQTMTLMRMLTPDYASPEQVRNEPISTVSDVYSLGVILYLLLTGQSPYRVPNSSPEDILKAICDVEPEKPSTASTRAAPRDATRNVPASSSSESSRSEKEKRRKLQKILEGDLDIIVLQALRKEPRRRYASVDQFSEDTRRYLAGLPILAHKDTPAYRASKFIGRHKWGVAAGALLVVSLAAGMITTLWQARIARAERARAERRFNDVRQLANSLIFDIHDSIRDLPGSTPARKLIVDHALQYLDSLSQESRDDLSLQRELATAYERVGLVQGHYLQNNLGDTQGSLASYRKALKIREQIKIRSSDWNESLALAGCYRLVAHQQWAMGDYSDAVKNVLSAIATSEALDKVHPKDLQVLTELRFDYQTAGQIEAGDYAGSAGDPESVKDNIRNALQVDKVLLVIAPDDPDIQNAYANDLNNLGGTLDDDPKAALECYYKELEIEQKLYKRLPEARYARGIAHAYSHIAQTYDAMGDQPRSLENNSRGLEVSEQLVREDPKNAYFRQALAIAYANTADDLSKTGHKAQSLEYIENGLKIMRALVATDPENRQQRGYLAIMVRMKGSTFMNVGKPEAARREFTEALSLFESLHELDPTEAEGALIDVAACKEKIAEAASRLDNSKLAAEYFQQVLTFVEPALTKQKPDLNILYLAADSFSGLGDLELRKAHRSLKNSAEQRASWTLARSWYLKSLEVWHKIEHPRNSAPKDFDVGDPATVTKNLQQCEANLAASK